MLDHLKDLARTIHSVAIERTHLPKLMEKLQHFKDPERISNAGARAPGCPRSRDCFRQLPFAPSRIQQVLAMAATGVLRLIYPEDRRVRVYALDLMLSQCPLRADLNRCLCVHRIAAIGDRLALVRIEEPNFRQLARSLAEHYPGCSNGGFSNFVTVSIPPEGDVRAIHGGVHPDEIGPTEMEKSPPRGFEWFAVTVIGVKITVLALRGTYSKLLTERRPRYFTLMLDFGLVLNVRV